MIPLWALFLAVSFPSTSKIAWMQPQSFHLAIGMSRTEAMDALEKIGFKTKKGDDADHLIIDYADDKAVTIEFNNDRLRSIRFELFLFLPDAKTAFAEEKAFLQKTLGPPKPLKAKSVLLYDGVLPNVMVVVANDPKSANAQKGLGILVVRYYDPAPPH